MLEDKENIKIYKKVAKSKSVEQDRSKWDRERERKRKPKDILT